MALHCSCLIRLTSLCPRTLQRVSACSQGSASAWPAPLLAEHMAGAPARSPTLATLCSCLTSGWQHYGSPLILMHPACNHTLRAMVLSAPFASCQGHSLSQSIRSPGLPDLHKQPTRNSLDGASLSQSMGSTTSAPSSLSLSPYSYWPKPRQARAQ